ncbi:hypothetical protein [Mesoterricola sediminis]|uniref:hypothetical protein n=1 Tax=Mesoterricola sediminis TaxID=2927980 RepID=UPI0029308929|nr:hypothetical protein [Mesoterricola sediminis]
MAPTQASNPYAAHPAVIPPHPRRKNPAAWDSHLYKARHAIEHGFDKRREVSQPRWLWPAS